MEVVARKTTSRPRLNCYSPSPNDSKKISLKIPVSERQQLHQILREQQQQQQQADDKPSADSPDISRTAAGEVNHHGSATLESCVTPKSRWKSCEKRNARGETPLHVACIQGDYRQVKRLIEGGYSVNTCDHAGWTPLHEACNRGWYKVARLLIASGADVNASNRHINGFTPLHDAVVNGHLQIVKLLLRYGADSKAQTHEGKKAIDLAPDSAIANAILGNYNSKSGGDSPPSAKHNNERSSSITSSLETPPSSIRGSRRSLFATATKKCSNAKAGDVPARQMAVSDQSQPNSANLGGGGNRSSTSSQQPPAAQPQQQQQCNKTTTVGSSVSASVGASRLESGNVEASVAATSLVTGTSSSNNSASRSLGGRTTSEEPPKQFVEAGGAPPNAPGVSGESQRSDSTSDSAMREEPSLPNLSASTSVGAAKNDDPERGVGSAFTSATARATTPTVVGRGDRSPDSQSAKIANTGSGSSASSSSSGGTAALQHQQLQDTSKGNGGSSTSSGGNGGGNSSIGSSANPGASDQLPLPSSSTTTTTTTATETVSNKTADDGTLIPGVSGTRTSSAISATGSTATTAVGAGGPIDKSKDSSSSSSSNNSSSGGGSHHKSTISTTATTSASGLHKASSLTAPPSCLQELQLQGQEQHYSSEDGVEPMDTSEQQQQQPSLKTTSHGTGKKRRKSVDKDNSPAGTAATGPGAVAGAATATGGLGMGGTSLSDQQSLSGRSDRSDRAKAELMKTAARSPRPKKQKGRKDTDSKLGCDKVEKDEMTIAAKSQESGLTNAGKGDKGAAGDARSTAGAGAAGTGDNKLSNCEKNTGGEIQPAGGEKGDKSADLSGTSGGGSSSASTVPKSDRGDCNVSNNNNNNCNNNIMNKSSNASSGSDHEGCDKDNAAPADGLKVPPLKIVLSSASNGEKESTSNDGISGMTSNSTKSKQLPYIVNSPLAGNSPQPASPAANSPLETKEWREESKRVTRSSQRAQIHDSSSNNNDEDDSAMPSSGKTHPRKRKMRNTRGSAAAAAAASGSGQRDSGRGTSGSSGAQSTASGGAGGAGGSGGGGGGGSSGGGNSNNINSNTISSGSSSGGGNINNSNANSGNTSSSNAAGSDSGSRNIDKTMAPLNDEETLEVVPPPPEKDYFGEPSTMFNPYEALKNIRRAVDKRRIAQISADIRPTIPHSFKDYLLNKCTYALEGNPASRQGISMVPPPSGLPFPLRELFIQQEHERYRLRLQHLMERDKLVLAAEQEILRVNAHEARAIAGQTIPLSVTTVLRDMEIYNTLDPESNLYNPRTGMTAANPLLDNHVKDPSRYNNGRLFKSWLQDTDDKWERLKEGLLLRHHSEAEALRAVQTMDWTWKAKETPPTSDNQPDQKGDLKLGVKCSTSGRDRVGASIKESKDFLALDLNICVPMVHVSDDFDLLPS